MYFEANKDLMTCKEKYGDKNVIIVNLDSIEKIRRFVKKVCSFDVDCDLISWNDRFTVDAKSIMGVLSIDLTHPVKFCIYSSNAVDIAKCMDAISEFTM